MLKLLLRQNDNQQILPEISPVKGSRYLIINGDSYPTYILNLLWGLILVICGRDIMTYNAQPNIFKWEIFGSLLIVS